MCVCRSMYVVYVFVHEPYRIPLQVRVMNLWNLWNLWKCKLEAIVFELVVTSTSQDFEVVKKWWGCALLHTKCSCFMCKPAWEVYAILSSPSEEERKTSGPFCEFLIWYFCNALGVLLVMNTLEDEWYIVIKAYKSQVYTTPYISFFVIHVLWKRGLGVVY